jgi:hypothetical protein
MPKFLVVFAILLFLTIGILAYFKTSKTPSKPAVKTTLSTPVEIELKPEVRVINEKPQPPTVVKTEPPKPTAQEMTQTARSSEGLPTADRIEELFTTTGAKLPFVETVTYKSRVSWQKGRPAWLSDYATHYDTSRHFIARSLNGKADYFKQDVADGNKFNVFKPEKNIEFYIVIDTSRCKLWLYALDADVNERTLLKVYDVGLGRVDPSKASGLLTPLGKFSLGNKVAIFQPGNMGNYHGEKTEMIKVFGTRWIPFEKEIGETTEPAKGFGLHGVPWKPEENGKLAEEVASIGKYESDGCIRLATKDIEEIFAIIITKPATVELVKDFHHAKLPGKEKAAR